MKVWRKLSRQLVVGVQLGGKVDELCGGGLLATWLLLGVAVPFMLHLSVVYSERLGFPGLGQAFGVVSFVP